MTISNTRLQNFRRELTHRKLRLSDVADRLGKSPAQISAFGGRNPTKGIGNQIAREIEEMFGLKTGALDIPDGDRSRTEQPSHMLIPILSSSQAYEWLTSPDLLREHSDMEWAAIPGIKNEKAFLLLIDGSSMSPKINAGDRVAVDPALQPITDEFGAFIDHSSQSIVIRQVSIESKKYYVCASNQDWPDRIIQLPEHWSLVGKCLWILKHL